MTTTWRGLSVLLSLIALSSGLEVSAAADSDARSEGVEDDTVAPVIGSFAPDNGSVVSGSHPRIVVAYTDPAPSGATSSGVDVQGVRLWIDGDDVSPNARVASNGLAFDYVDAFGPGAHSVVVQVPDHAGNRGTARSEFEYRPVGDLTICPVAPDLPYPGERIPVALVVQKTSDDVSFGLELVFDQELLSFQKMMRCGVASVGNALAAELVAPSVLRIATLSIEEGVPAVGDTVGCAVFEAAPDAAGVTALSASIFTDRFSGLNACSTMLAFGVPPNSVCPLGVQAFVPVGTVRVPIIITGAGPLEAFGLDFEFDTTYLTFDAVVPSGFTSGWDNINGALFSPGVIRIGGFTIPPETPADPDTIAYVDFLVDAVAVDSALVVTTNFVDDFDTVEPCSAFVRFVTPPDFVCPLNVEVFVPVGTVRVPIVVGGAGPLEAFGLDFVFDTTYLTFDAVVPSGFTSGWDNFNGALFSPGVVRIGGFTIPPETPADPETIAYVDFLVDPAAVDSALIFTTDFVDDFETVEPCSAFVRFVTPPDSVCPLDVEVFVPDGTVRVPIVFGGAGAFDAFGLDFVFDTTYLTFDAVVPSGFTSAWDTFDGVLFSPGVVRIGGFTIPPETPDDPDTLCYVDFLVDPNAVDSALVFTTTFVDDFLTVEPCSAFVIFRTPPDSVCPLDVETFVPDGTVSLPIVLGGAGPLKQFLFELRFDTTYLTFDDVLPSGFTAVWDKFDGFLDSAGVVRINGTTDPPETPADPDTVGYVTFLVDSNAVDSALVFTTNFLNDFETVEPCSAFVTFQRPPDSVCPVDVEGFVPDSLVLVPILIEGAGSLGDFTFDVCFDTTYLDFDSVLASGFTSGWDTITVVPSVECVTIHGVTDPKETPADPDTLLYVQFVMNPAAVDSALVLTTNFGGDFETVDACSAFVTFRSPPDLVCPIDVETFVPDGTVSVPIVLGGAGPLDSFIFKSRFDATFLTFHAVVPSGFTSGWDKFQGLLVAPGVVRINGVTDPAETPADPDTLGYVNFFVDPAAVDSALIFTSNFKGDFETVEPCSAFVVFRTPPDFVCPIDVEAFVPDSTIRVPIVFGGAGPFDAFGVDLVFDATYLALDSVLASGFTDNWDDFDFEFIAPHTVRIGGFTDPPETPGDPDTLCYVDFFVDPAAVDSALVFTTNFVDDFLTVEPCSAFVTFRRPPDSVCPLDVEVFVPDGTVRVPVVLTGAGPLDAFNFDLCFDTTFLDVANVVPSGFTSGWDNFGFLAGTECVTITGSTVPPETPADPDTIAYVDFLVDLDATGTARLVTKNFGGDFATIDSCEATITFVSEDVPRCPVCPEDQDAFVNAQTQIVLPIILGDGAEQEDDGGEGDGQRDHGSDDDEELVCDPLTSIAFDVTFDADHLEFIEVQPSAFTRTWDSFMAELLNPPGNVIHIEASTSPAQTPHNPDVLAYVIFDIVGNPQPPASATIRTHHFDEGLVGTLPCEIELHFLQCQDCPGGVTDLTLRYLDEKEEPLTVKDEDGRTVFEDFVSPGETLEFSGFGGGPLGEEIKIYEDDDRDAEIETDCSEPFGPNFIDEDYEVVRAASNGTPLCPVGPCHDERPCMLVMRYTGEGCGVGHNSQDDDTWDCDGGAPGSQTVRIVANDEDEFDDDDADIWFDGIVQPGEFIFIESALAGEERLNSKTFVHVLDAATDDLLQRVEFRTSCSEPLNLGDRFGSLVLVDFASKGQCETPRDQPRANRQAIWPANQRMVDIVMSLPATVDPGMHFELDGIYSSEPDRDYFMDDVPRDIQGAELGTPDLAFRLRAESMNPLGRVYTVVYTITVPSGTYRVTTDIQVGGFASGAAYSSAGFQADGRALSVERDVFALVLHSIAGPGAVAAFDATAVADGEAYVGNGKGALRPVDVAFADVNGDQFEDVALIFSTAEALALAALSDRKDGPLGLYYHTPDGERHLAPSIFELGPPVGLDGFIESTAAADVVSAMPQVTGLAGIFPNPFGPETTVSFTLARPEQVRLAVYDLRGALVRTIVDEGRPAGRYQVRWDGRNGSRERVASGVYFVRFAAGGDAFVKKVVLLR